MRKKAVKNIIVFSDTHIGCRLGLCCPEGVDLDDGGHYVPSEAQQIVWSWWREFWDKWVPEVTKGEPYDIVFNGDAIDGVHHSSTTQISHNMRDQLSLAYKILAPIVRGCNKYYHIRGTEAHVGKSATHEEQLARDLGAVPNKEGQHARWELWKTLEGSLVHFLHHIGTTSSSAHEASALNAELSAMFVEAGRWGLKPPQIVVRSHRHRCIEVRLPVKSGYATVVTTPAWQLKTPFVYKIAGARLTTPQIGGLLIRKGDRRLFTEPMVWNIERPEAE